MKFVSRETASSEKKGAAPEGDVRNARNDFWSEGMHVTAFQRNEKKKIITLRG